MYLINLGNLHLLRGDYAKIYVKGFGSHAFLFFHISLIHCECEVHFYKNIDVRLTKKAIVFLLEISNMEDQDTL
jgi:hypothetical protein